MERVVIIGGDAAGMSAAAQALRGRTPPTLVVFERGQHTSYAACGLPYFVGGVVPAAHDLVARTPEEHRAKGIDVRLGSEVVAIDTAGQKVHVRVGDESATREEGYDQLVVATGATPIRPRLANLDSIGVFGVQTIPDAVTLDDHLRELKPKRGVVVGGGYIGLEMAEALLLRGLDVVIVEKLPQPMATLDADMAEHVVRGLESLGVELRLGVGVLGFDVDSDRRVRSVATDSGAIDAELVVLGLGVRPNVALAQAAGIDIGPSGGIVTDAYMATSRSGVWAAGDCAEILHRVTGRPVSIALGTHANKQGRVVGINISGGRASFPGVLGTAITKVGHLEIARTGLNEREAAGEGMDYTTGLVDGLTRAHYYPGAQPVQVKVIADRPTGRMIGAQIVGGEGAGKRIDALAVAIWNEMSAEEFSQSDLAYAPSFSPVWDPILIAARNAARTN